MPITRLRGGALAACSWLALNIAFTGVASAQSADQSGEGAAAAASSETASEAIVVTGSRIARRDYTEVSPIVTVGAEQLAQAGQVTVEFGLNMLPQMMTGTSTASVQNRTGRSSLNLRGLGEARSLVLLDGRRIQPATAGGSVDITSLPSAVIQNVEVITGGASAAYGSDAMAGVVNFILKKDFSGVEAEGKYNFTDHGGGASTEVNLTMGDNFDNGSGNAMLVLSYANRERLLRSQRDFFRTLFTPNPGSGRQITNFRGEYNDVTILKDNRIQSNQGYLYDLISPIERYSVFGRVNHDIFDDVNVYAQAMFSSFKTENLVAPQTIGTAGTSASIPATNPFIPDDLRTLYDSRANPNAPVPVTYGFDQLGKQDSDTNWTIYQLIAGLEGKLGVGDLSWNVYGSHGQTDQHLVQSSVYNVRRLQQLFNAPDGGASICEGGLNIFGPHDAVSQACLDYISATPYSYLTIKQTNIEGTLTGTILKLPAGDLSFAAGADWRKEGYSERNDDQAVAGEIPGLTVAPSTSGSRSVAEVYGELLIPLLSDLPLIHHLEADIGYRYSDYENAKGVSSYNASLNWRPFDFLTIRGGYSRAIRAPTLEDLFASAVPVSLNLGAPGANSTGGDPCDVRSSYRQGANGAAIRNLCIGLGVPAGAADTYTLDRQTLFGTASGNPGLSNEKADTITAGIIFESPFDSPALSRLRMSVDYFDIKIKNGIGQIPLNSAFARCFNIDAEKSNPSYDPANENCSFFPRDPQTGLIREINSRTLNLAQYNVRGIDFQLDYQFPMDLVGLGGTLGLNFVGSYLDRYEVQDLPGLPLLNYAGYGGRPTIRPKWKTLTTLSYMNGPFEGTFRWRFAQSVKDISLVTNPASTTKGAPDYHYFDLSLGWNFNEDTRIQFIVSNLFDQDPYALGGTPGETDQTTYDVIGRNFTVSLRKKF